MSKYLIILLIAFAVYGCGSDPMETIMTPTCEYSIGEVVEITLYETGLFNSFKVNLNGCDNPLIITLTEDVQLTIGDVVKVRITNKKSQFSYEGVIVE